jgi:hypothetical protein
VSLPPLSKITERRWRHLAHWLWLALPVWWLGGGVWYGITKDASLILNLVFVPWWLLLSGILGYSLMLIRMRWGTIPVVLLLVLASGVGSGAWTVAGIHSAITCALMAPLIVGWGLLLIPPPPLSKEDMVLAIGLGTAEPFLVLGLLTSITLLIIHFSWMPLPGVGWWWALAGTSLTVLVWSQWLQRRWRQQAARSLIKANFSHTIDLTSTHQ